MFDFQTYGGDAALIDESNERPRATCIRLSVQGDKECARKASRRTLMRCKDVGLGVALDYGACAGHAGAGPIPNVWHNGGSRRRWSRRPSCVDDGQQACRRRLCRHDSKVWFTVAKGITSEVFYPRLDIPNMEDMQYVVTDGSTFVDLERDATSHADLDAGGKRARVHRHEYGQTPVAEVPDHQHLYHR